MQNVGSNTACPCRHPHDRHCLQAGRLQNVFVSGIEDQHAVLAWSTISLLANATS